MNKNKFTYVLSMIIALVVLSGCNQNDDLTEIFLKYNKKLTNIVERKSGKPTPYKKWKKSEEERLREPVNYILTFSGIEKNGEIANGTFIFKLVNQTITGNYFVDGKSRKIWTTNVHTESGNDSDSPAKEVIKAMKNLKHYEGDSNTFSLYYKDELSENSNPYMLFKRGEEIKD